MLKTTSYIVISLCIFLSKETLAQCPIPSFALEESVCTNQNIATINSSENATHFDWNFCSGDLAYLPTGNNVLNNTNFFRARSIKLVEENGLWYGFTISATANILMRLDFGNSTENIPTYVDLGNVGAALTSAFDFDMIKIETTWHMLVANGGAKNILHYSFENGIEDMPSLASLNTPLVFDDAGPNAIKIIQDSDEVHAFVSKGTIVGNSKLIRLDFDGATISSSPNTTEITITGGNQLRGVDIIKECENWFGFIISQNTNDVYKLEFGSNITNNTPNQVLLNDLGLFNIPASLKTVNEAGRFYAIIANARIEDINTAIYIVDLGESLSNNDISIEKYFTPEMSGGIYAIDLVDFESKWKAFSFNLSTRNLLRFDFLNNCSTPQPISEEIEPIISYSESGEYYISLTATDEFGNTSYHVDTVMVTSDIAPDISFSSQYNCQTVPIEFTSITNGTGLTYTWDFGDASGSSDPNPSHSYASSGEYEVTLVVDDGTCSNFTSETILVYDEPVPDFTVPGGNICTNQNYIFTNTTPGDFDDLITYEWFLDGISVGTSEDLTITFTSGGTKELKLVASLPGCDVEIAKNLSNIKVGALPDFTFDDSCVGELVQFMNESTGSITDYNWDFGNGFTSILEDPQIQYTNSGEFLITLELTNTDGCVTNESRTITIHPLPAVNFEQELACEKLSTQFNDLTIITVDNLSAWEWDFGDGSANVLIQNPTHVFGEFGNYSVKLIATSSFGCVDSLEQAVNVLQSPLADFEYNKLCEDVEINLIDQSEPLPSESIVQWAWNIGGAFSAVQNPAYTFNEPLDYNVALTVTSENLCTSTVSKTLNIPAKPEVTFSISDNCDNQIAILTDNTLPEDDTIIDWKWIYDEIIIGDLNQILYEFEEGTYSIDLELITENGCSYQKQQEITIYKSPEASFTPSFDFGAPPLELSFNNTSSGAVTYSWDFNDGNTSVEENPGNTFVSVGDYTVQLVAVSAENCKDTTSTIIQVLDPLSDLALNSMSVININGQDKLSLAITNNGTVREENIKLSLDFGGELRLNEVINETLNPGQSMTIQLDFSLTDSRIKYLCGEISSIYDLDDARLDDNGYCINFSNSQAIIEPPYPNPTNGDVSIDIILENSVLVNIEIVNSKGDLIDVYQQEISRGPNTLTLDMSGLKEGIYFISISALNEKKKYRIVLVD